MVSDPLFFVEPTQRLNIGIKGWGLTSSPFLLYRFLMGVYVDILRKILEANWILSSLRDYERLYGRIQQVAKETQNRERLLRASLPEFYNTYLSQCDLIATVQDSSRPPGVRFSHPPSCSVLRMHTTAY